VEGFEEGCDAVGGRDRAGVGDAQRAARRGHLRPAAQAVAPHGVLHEVEQQVAQQDRVTIARAQACDVEILFADEPTGSLDADTAAQIVEVFRELAHDQGKCVTVVTHSAHVANQSDKVLTLANGRFKS
jgi:ABC-type lipoprotein export system ATPase subunit